MRVLSAWGCSVFAGCRNQILTLLKKCVLWILWISSRLFHKECNFKLILNVELRPRRKILNFITLNLNFILIYQNVLQYPLSCTSSVFLISYSLAWRHSTVEHVEGAIYLPHRTVDIIDGRIYYWNNGERLLTIGNWYAIILSDLLLRSSWFQVFQCTRRVRFNLFAVREIWSVFIFIWWPDKINLLFWSRENI